MSLVEVKNLSKTYHDGEVETPVLKGINFKVSEGEFVAVMGPSGSGKSTLLQILGMLDSFTGGEYLFEGKSVALYSKEEIARILNEKVGFIFQSFNLLSKTSVLENIKLPLLYSDIPESKWNELAISAIESVGLLHRINHEPSQLSGGERQRVAIARALVTNPSIIFADEPTGNLDSKSGKVVMEIIQKLNDEGKTIMLITHESTTAEHASRIIHIQDGHIVSDDTSHSQRRASLNYTK